MDVSSLICLWDSRATGSTNKRRKTKYYERKMRPNKVEYSKAAGLYCKMHDAKMPFCMPEFYSRKITEHRFHNENEKIKLGIGYYMIIGHDLMVHLVLTADFRHQVLQWDGATVPMKEPSGLLGKSDLSKCKIQGRYADCRTSFYNRGY